MSNIPFTKTINCAVCRDMGLTVPNRQSSEQMMREGRQPKAYCIYCNGSFPLSKEVLEYALSKHNRP